MSGKAALEISGIVKNSIKEAEAVATENKGRVESGGSLAKETKEKMEVVLQKLTGILQGASKIVDASKEQGLGIGQISTSVESISQMTQETAGTAEESASASAELSAQAKSLMDLVDQLRLVVVGEMKTEGSYENSSAHSTEASNVSHDKKSKVVQLKSKMKTFKATPIKGSKVANGVAVADSGVQADSQSWDKL